MNVPSRAFRLLLGAALLRVGRAFSGAREPRILSRRKEAGGVKIRSRRFKRLSIALVGALFALAVVPTALATPPVRETISISGTSPDIGLCSFPVQLSFSDTIAQTSFFDQDGNLIRQHGLITEQDTFSANGTTLVGDTYSVSLETYFENGAVVGRKLSGVAERVHLPDGGVFVVAGQASDFGLTVDHGTNGDVSAFCAALS